MRLGSPRPKEIFIGSIGSVDPEVLRFAAGFVERTFGFRTRIQGELLRPGPTHFAAEGLLDGRAVLGALSDDLSLDAVRTVGIAAQAVRYEGCDDCFGLGQTEGKVAVVSVRRIGRVRERERLGEGAARAQERFRRRLYKIVIHELGHTFLSVDRPHCPERGCLMGPVLDLGDLDGLSTSFCAGCRKKIAEHLAGDFNNHVTYYNLGCYFQSRGLHRKALASFRRSVAIKDDWASAWNNMGVSLAKTGRPAEAADAYRRAAALDPEHETARLNLAAVLLGLGDVTGALRALEAVARRGNPVALLRLGKISRDRLGDPEAAARHFRAFFRVGGKDEETRRWLRHWEAERK
jgi:predicted Zn-dependent protease